MGVRVSRVKPSNCFRLHPTSIISVHSTIPVPHNERIEYNFFSYLQSSYQYSTYLSAQPDHCGTRSSSVVILFRPPTPSLKITNRSISLCIISSLESNFCLTPSARETDRRTDRQRQREFFVYNTPLISSCKCIFWGKV